MLSYIHIHNAASVYSQVDQLDGRRRRCFQDLIADRANCWPPIGLRLGCGRNSPVCAASELQSISGSSRGLLAMSMDVPTRHGDRCGRDVETERQRNARQQ